MEKPLLEEAFKAAPEWPQFKEEDTMVMEPISEDTINLLYVGKLEEVVNIGNHEIRIRTLKIGEELNAALIANRYKDTVEAARALATALVAAAIESVDGLPLVKDLGPRDNSLESKFDYILNNWYWEVVNQIFQEYNKLLTRVQEAAEEIKKG